MPILVENIPSGTSGEVWPDCSRSMVRKNWPSHTESRSLQIRPSSCTKPSLYHEWPKTLAQVGGIDGLGYTCSLPLALADDKVLSRGCTGYVQLSRWQFWMLGLYGWNIQNKTRTMALKHPAKTPTKNLPETPPKTPKINPWTDHPGTRDGPTLNPGWGHPDPDLGLWMGHPESRGQSQTPSFVGFEGSGWPIQSSRSGSGWPHPGFWVGPSWVPGWSVQGSILGVLGGVSRKVFCARFGRVF